MDLSEYRESISEINRTQDLMHIIRELKIPGGNALDVGARDGHFSKLLTDCFENVIALDIEKPSFSYMNVTCVEGDVTSLKFDDNSFDFVFCAEVLEHIPSNLLQNACLELSRVTRSHLLVGVPYKQDIRFGRTTCYSCGEKNPPWGHVNSFNRKIIGALFPGLKVKNVSFVGRSNASTNPISSLLMDFAGNPYGTYQQDEPCVKCGRKLVLPPERTFLQKLLTKAAFYCRNVQKPFIKYHPNWIHILMEKT